MLEVLLQDLDPVALARDDLVDPLEPLIANR
jgi:hypothetical protein